MQRAREKPTATNQPQRDCKSQAKDHSPTAKPKTTKERKPMQETKKTGYSVQENRNPKK
jgi:hypothetical protein